MAQPGKLLLIFLMVCVAGVVYAQKGLKVDIDLVMVNVSVTDPENHVITDLKPDNFQLFEDKVEQQIKYFSSEVAPLSLGIVFDISHSMENKLELARTAAVRFLETGTPEDEYFLIEFSNRAEVTEDFTSDISRLRDQLSLKPAAGATALYDAVYLGLSKVKAGNNPKKALLLITDGEDNHSRYSRGNIREFLRESDVQIYVIDLGRALIGDLAEMTGGQYVLGYESSNTNRDGKYRKIRVKTSPPAGLTKINVRAREGYYSAGN
jgi:Ca-activated chloride channel homolog